MADASNSDSVEIWKAIPGWEGLYEVCAASQEVRSVDRFVRAGPDRWRLAKGKILSPVLANNGYMVLGLRRNGAHKLRYLHAIICEAAHGPRPSSRHVVRHLNGNCIDNQPDNLAWGTQKENSADMLRHGTRTRGEKIANAVLSEDSVREIRDRVRLGESHASVARDYNVSRPSVTLIAAGRRWGWLV